MTQFSPAFCYFVFQILVAVKIKFMIIWVVIPSGAYLGLGRLRQLPRAVDLKGRLLSCQSY